MTRLRALRIVCLGVAGLPLEGCSFLFVNGPPEAHLTMSSFECTESRAAPIWDVALAGFGVLTAVTAKDDPEDFGYLYSWDAQTYQAIGVSIALMYSMSSVEGFQRVKDCRNARRALNERLGRRLPLDPRPTPGGPLRERPLYDRSLTPGVEEHRHPPTRLP